MKKKKILCLFLVIIFFCMNYNFSNARENFDLIDEIVKKCKSQVNEYGIKICFNTKQNGEKICRDLVENLCDCDEVTITTQKSPKGFCQEFSCDIIKGYVKSEKQNNEFCIVINIFKIDNLDRLLWLENNIRTKITLVSENIKYYKYLKAKLPDENIRYYNNEIKKILINYRVQNIETVKINNGFSTIAYTKKYTPKKINGKLIDLNYAVCNYSSGSYIIIGTPEIYMPY